MPSSVPDGTRNNPVYGEKQTLTSLDVAADGRAATFVWDGVTSELGDALDIKLTLTVTLTARQAIYAMTVENHSPYDVENVYCPYLGDVAHPPDADWFKTFIYQYATAAEWSLWPTYQNTARLLRRRLPHAVQPGKHERRRTDVALFPAAQR